MSFEIGDVVVVKSGGPRMTVDGILSPSSDLRCVWFDGEKIQSTMLNPASVKKVEEKNGQSVLSMRPDGSVKHSRI